MALDIYEYLSKSKGYYNTEKLKPNIFEFFRYNLYRFPWAIAYIKSRAQVKISLLLKLSFAAWVISNVITKKKGSYGWTQATMFTWLMREEMSKYFICRLAMKMWNKKGLSINQAFAWYFFKYPVFAKWAKE